ncbi:MAG: TrkH family potassium uptake protein [Verrucomicrobiota bacterium]
MNYRLISKLISVIVATLAMAFLACLGLGQVFDDSVREDGILDEWLISSAIALGLAMVFYLLGRNSGNKLLRKEALTVIGLGWLLASMVGAIPYYLILRDSTLADCIFESTSGLTTTGATVFTGLDNMPTSLLFWRCLSQWIGGLGVVVFFVALLSSLGAGAKILFSHESSGHSTDIQSGRIQSGVTQIMFLYLGLSVACMLVFHWCGMSWFDAICHMFTTVSTGGFSTHDASAGHFGSATLEWAMIVFMALGGMSFFVMLRVLRGDFKALFRNTEVMYYYLIMIVVSVLLTIMLLGEVGVESLNLAIREATFQAVSILTTTGYTTVDYQIWPPVGHTLLLLLMVIGGCSGSTAGGTKVVRFAVIMKVCRQQIERAYRTRVVRPLYMNGRVLDKQDQEGVINYVLLLGIVSICSMLILAMIEHQLSYEGGFSAMLSCLYNIGPGFNEIGPTQTYGHFSAAAKVFLSLLMIMGRLELYAILVLLSPSLWRRFT